MVRQIDDGMPDEVILKNIVLGTYTINSDKSIDVVGTVDISDHIYNKIPFKFRNIQGNFYCDSNQLTTLENAPKVVSGAFWCDGNKLRNLIDAPNYVGGDFRCKRNNLISLEGSPKFVGGDFFCSHNNLQTLKGISKKIDGSVVCHYNPELWNIDDLPKKTAIDFDDKIVRTNTLKRLSPDKVKKEDFEKYTQAVTTLF